MHSSDSSCTKDQRMKVSQRKFFAKLTITACVHVFVFVCVPLGHNNTQCIRDGGQQRLLTQAAPQTLSLLGGQKERVREKESEREREKERVSEVQTKDR